MPTSTAATTTRASSPAARPATLSGIRTVPLGRLSVGESAGIESHRGDRAVAIAGRDFETVAAPLHRQRDAPWLVERNVDQPVGDPLGQLDRLEIPGIVAPVILILGLDPEQLIAQAGARERLAGWRRHDHIEARVLALAPRAAVEQRLDPVQRA